MGVKDGASKSLTLGLFMLVLGFCLGGLAAGVHFGNSENYVRVTDTERQKNLVYDPNKGTWRDAYRFMLYPREREKYAVVRIGRIAFPVTYTTTKDGTEFCAADIKKGEEGESWCTTIRKKSVYGQPIELRPNDIDLDLYEATYFSTRTSFEK